MANLSKGSAAEHPLNRFMAMSLMQYLHGSFMAGSTGAQDVLRAVHLDGIADEIDNRLAMQIGGNTVRTYISEIRNTRVAHPTFDPKHAMKRAFGKVDLRDNDIRGQFFGALIELWTLTRFTLRHLRETYPITARLDDSRWKPVDNPP